MGDHFAEANEVKLAALHFQKANQAVLSSDVSERKKNEERLRLMADINDSLSG